MAAPGFVPFEAWAFLLPASGDLPDPHLGFARLVHQHRSRLTVCVMTKTTPAPLLRLQPQPAFCRIAMHVTQLLHALVFREHNEVVEPRVPYAAAFDWLLPERQLARIPAAEAATEIIFLKYPAQRKYRTRRWEAWLRSRSFGRRSAPVASPSRRRAGAPHLSTGVIPRLGSFRTAVAPPLPRCSRPGRDFDLALLTPVARIFHPHPPPRIIHTRLHPLQRVARNLRRDESIIRLSHTSHVLRERVGI